ncbi:hypothetical protein BST27_29635 [Mycobacterium intermedium]|uniref:Uncharacterized protein n=1 Tax=Mycobacterium intermedium TaxID=28445 RepID=A0A1E3S7P2_MYCIE|nr:hypothetical protein [Mycobacterium intermedium]MCV6965326.1 hypothetical protein [Mycobacterium intermedium]ODQ98120.1 hypothetical protein BHQ20_23495 [Mycobacterium intermedium]OPE47054.1 hypothetical protein BV508_23490 [Mycobacterium intermedium]ORA90604.1 hypothetical protein BST27_29635 [Mycobacterium intermedium]
MLTTAGTDARTRPLARVLFLVTTVFGIAAVLPGRWQAIVRRWWSFAVYYVGYRLLSVQLSCGSLAVSGVPFVTKHI